MAKKSSNLLSNHNGGFQNPEAKKNLNNDMKCQKSWKSFIRKLLKFVILQKLKLFQGQ